MEYEVFVSNFLIEGTNEKVIKEKFRPKSQKDEAKIDKPILKENKSNLLLEKKE